jgi:hypothetical protein
MDQGPGKLSHKLRPGVLVLDVVVTKSSTFAADTIAKYDFNRSDEVLVGLSLPPAPCYQNCIACQDDQPKLPKR